jgi:hypothetical protein
MTVTEIAELMTALATATTVGFLAWDRWEKRRAIEPTFEITSMRMLGPTKRYFLLDCVIRNHASVGLRFGAVIVVAPSDATLSFEGKSGTGLQFQIDIEPHKSHGMMIEVDVGMAMREWEKITLRMRYRCALQGMGKTIERDTHPITL